MDQRVEMAGSVESLESPEGLCGALTRISEEEGRTHITDLPAVVIGSILSRIPDPVNVASAFKASRVFWSVAQSAPFRLRLRPTRVEHGSIGIGDDWGLLSRRTEYDAEKVASWTRAVITGIRRVMPSTQELDLAGCPVLDDDLAAVLVDLRSLNRLVLDNCQKLTSAIADELAVSVRSGPRVLSLQRCFRMAPAPAGNLLVAAAADGSRLQVVLLSHLDRLDLPWDSPTSETGKDGSVHEIAGGESAEVVKNISTRFSGTGLRILALHNCGGLQSSKLTVISETCPYLEILMLGGSTEGLSLSRTDTITREKVVAASTALVSATEILSKLRILEITFFSAQVLLAVREQISSRIHVWDFCDKNSVAAAASMVASLKTYVEEFRFPGNWRTSYDRQFLDKKFLEPPRKDSVDFSITNLADAHHTSTPGEAQRHACQFSKENWGCTAEDVLMTLRAGTNCSDTRRRTPLHNAAARGDPEMVVNLLSIGASARRMKDSRGATALFTAAEQGHGLVCGLLLKGGADLLASNRTGETPLYIAALCGHTDAVAIMLAHCRDQGVNWQDAEVYGDGWTPLMAATLADRQEVGKVLLAAAVTNPTISSSSGTEQSNGLDLTSNYDHEPGCQDGNTRCESDWNSGGGPLSQTRVSSKTSLSRGAAPQLLDARNRYGQTALHIAARQDSQWFVDTLLKAGASVDIRDEKGLRAIDVARKRHSTVEETLKTWQEVQKKKVGNQRRA